MVDSTPRLVQLTGMTCKFDLSRSFIYIIMSGAVCSHWGAAGAMHKSSDLIFILCTCDFGSACINRQVRYSSRSLLPCTFSMNNFFIRIIKRLLLHRWFLMLDFTIWGQLHSLMYMAGKWIMIWDLFSSGCIVTVDWSPSSETDYWGAAPATIYTCLSVVVHFVIFFPIKRALPERYAIQANRSVKEGLRKNKIWPSWCQR